jgi:hypothetical protein
MVHAPRILLLTVAVALVIWLAYLLSAALMAVGGQIPGLSVASAEAATPLACGASPCGAGTPQDFEYAAPANAWAVVGVRSATGLGNANVCLFQDAALTQPFTCSSTVSNTVVDFVAVDYHHTPATTDYVRSSRASGSGDVCTGLDCGGTTLALGSSTNFTWSAGSIVRVFNLVAPAGLYRLGLAVTSGTADLGIAVLSSAGQANYAGGRADALVEADKHGAGAGEGLYFAAATADTFALVVWSNTAAGSANYRIDLRTAKQLQPNTATNEPGTPAADFFHTVPAPRGWSVLASRPAPATPSSDVDLRFYSGPAYLIAERLKFASAEPGIVDFIVTNWTNVPGDTASLLTVSLGPIGPYRLDWAFDLPALAPTYPVAVDVGGRVGLAWRTPLFAGVDYVATFTPTAGTKGDAAISIFGPTSAVPTFTHGTRADSLAGSDVWGESAGGWSGDQGVEVFAFTPQVSGEFLVYLYQKSSTTKNVSGTLLLEASSLVGVIGPGGARGGFAAPRPSPAGADETVRFAFDSPAGGAMRLAVYDARGRLVKVVDEGVRAAGPAFATWDGRTHDGLRAAPGLYFARLERAGMPAEVRRLVRLD